MLAGVNVVWAANHWQEAVRCHAENHPGVEHVRQDLNEFDWTLCPGADVALASPVCQFFSQAGQPARKGTGGSHSPKVENMKRKGARDRNTSWAVLAMADSVRPERMIVENVVDMLRWDAFDAWRGVLHAMGYDTEVHRLNALDYGGAQDRERLVITARLGAPACKLEGRTTLFHKTIGDCLDPDDAPENRWQEIASKSERIQRLTAKAKAGAGERCFWNNVSDSRGRTLDEPFPTATTQSGTQFCLIDGDRYRVLNPRELARSMSFPEWYVLPTQRKIAGKMIGNAIDVEFARGIVEQVMA